MERVGPYLLIGKLATGGMAEVFLARREGPAGFQKLGVLKRILPQFSEDPDFRRMFLDEARLAALINHPNVVQIFELSESGQDLYIAMEYVAGFDLAKVMDASLKQRRLVPSEVAARIVADAAAGLDAAHRLIDTKGRPRPVVHRDISPENLLVSEVGQVKVVDFGIARAGEGTAHTRSASGRLKGKVHYHAPEHIRDQPLDGRADVYALGVVLYELLCARRPFEGLSEVDVMRACVERDAPPPSKWYPTAEPELSDLALAALVREPDKRPTAAELRDDLELWLRKHPCTAADVERFLLEVIPADAEDRRRARKLIEAAPSSSDHGQAVRVQPKALTPAAAEERRRKILLVGAPIGAMVLLTAATAIYASRPRPVVPRAQPPPDHASTTGATPPPPEDVVQVPDSDAGRGPTPVPRVEVKPPPTPVRIRRKGTGLLNLSTHPTCEVSIDNSPPAQSPIKGRELDVGKHKVRLVNRNLGIDLVRTITVTKHDSTNLNLEVARLPVTVEVYPWAKVNVDGQDLGTTPVNLSLYEGQHQVVLSYRSQQKKVALDVRGNRSNKIRYRFDRK